MKKPPTGLPTLKVLFVTDFHVDPEYTTGAKVDCGDPLCCRTADHKSAKKGGKVAPKWGWLLLVLAFVIDCNEQTLKKNI